MSFTSLARQLVKIIKPWVLTLLLLLMSCQGSPGEDIRKTPACNPMLDQHCNNSCIAGNEDIVTALVSLTGSLGLYIFADATFDMITAENERPISSLKGTPNAVGKSFDNGVARQVYITDKEGNLCDANNSSTQCMRNKCQSFKSDGTCSKRFFPEIINGCGVMTDNVRFYYNGKLHIFDERDRKVLKTPIRVKGTIINFTQDTPVRSIIVADALCVQVKTIIGWLTLGCKYKYNKQESIFKISSCLAGSACANDTPKHSKSILPITGVAVECMKDAIIKIFVDGCAESEDNANVSNYINLFPKFQENMHTVVLIVVTLYVIIFGIQIVLGNEAPKNSEIFMFIIKIVLVIYFSVGFKPGDTSKDIQTSSNGALAIILPGFEAITSTLSSFMGSSAGNSSCSNNGTLCYYDPDSYDAGYSYLALWDAFDCRMAYYLGFISSDNRNGGGDAVGSVIPIMFGAGILLWLVNLLIFAVLCFLFTIFIVSIVVYVINFYIIALIALVIVAYFAPIFVPMSLFKFTKGMFDSWLSLLFSLALQPVVVVAFVLLMMSVFDSIMFDTCCWEKHGNLWQIADSSFSDNRCIYSAGYLMYFDFTNILKGPVDIIVAKVPGGFFDPRVLVPVFMMLLVCFLFYSFAQKISGFAAEVVGGPDLGKLTVIGPTLLFDMLVNQAENATKGAAKSAPLPKENKENSQKTASAKITSGGDK
jgi:type IV secretion system protein VirB6